MEKLENNLANLKPSVQSKMRQEESVTNHVREVSLVYNDSKKVGHRLGHKTRDLEQKYEKLVSELQQMKLQANSSSGATQNQGNMLKSSFSLRLIQEELLVHYVMLKFNHYDEIGDLTEHLYHFWKLMAFVDDYEGLLCRVFPTSLQGLSLTWFYQLPLHFDYKHRTTM